MNGGSVDFNIRKFDMRSIQYKLDPSTKQSVGPVVVFIGTRGTGKSFLIRDLLYYHQNIPVGTVVSPTEQFNEHFGKFIPRLFIHNEYSTVIVENILKRQKQILFQKKRDLAAYGRSAVDPRAFFILDDCLYDDKWTRDKLMKLLFMNGRHYMIFLIFSMQYALGVPPALRSNIDYVFILREPDYGNRERIYRNYAGMVPTFEAFCHILNQCTENNECLVIHRSAKTNVLAEQIYWYKGQEHPDFKIGSKEFWDLSRTIGDEDEGEQYDPNKNRKRSAGPLINVHKRSTTGR